MTWYGDRKKHSQCAKGIKTGRKRYISKRRVYHHPRAYDVPIDFETKEVFKKGYRCPKCGIGLDNRDSDLYCINCNKNWGNPNYKGKGSLYDIEKDKILQTKHESEINRVGKEQAMREARWILTMMSRTEPTFHNTLGPASKERNWEHWNKKWERWKTIHPELAKDIREKKTFGRKRANIYLRRKRLIHREGHLIYV